jgi:hypothetical protein
MSRFIFIEGKPVLAPGTDYVSGAADAGVVDTGIDVYDFLSKDPKRIYLGRDTIRELADVAGVRDVKSVGETVHDAQEYNRGYMDAVKDRVGDQLIDLVDRLGLLAALLGSERADDVAALTGPVAVIAGGLEQLPGDRAPRARERGPRAATGS